MILFVLLFDVLICKTITCVFIVYFEAMQTQVIYCPNNCGRIYSGIYKQKILKRHLAYECGVEPRFLCHLCSSRFRHNSNLKKHLRNIHNTFV